MGAGESLLASASSPATSLETGAFTDLANVAKEQKYDDAVVDFINKNDYTALKKVDQSIWVGVVGERVEQHMLESSFNPMNPEIQDYLAAVNDWNGNADAKTLLKDLTRKEAKFDFKSLGDEGAKLVARYIGLNSALTKLELRGNNIGAGGGTAIGNALCSNSTLTQLSLQYNSMGAAVEKQLKAAKAKSATLKYLYGV